MQRRNNANYADFEKISVSIVKKQLGVTIFEMLLVIAIAASIILFSLNQYLFFQRDANVQQVQYNVNTLFKAMAMYYKAECYGRYSVSGAPPLIPGKLNPGSSPGDPFKINITTDLVNGGFLTDSIPINPLIDDAGANTNGYVAQFNLYTSSRTICAGGTTASNAYPPSCLNSTAVNVGTIYIWKPQVAVKLKNAATASQYLSLLGGDCLSTESGGVVAKCNSYPGTGDYVVWERLPSFASISSLDSQSDFWVMNPIGQQFNDMYRSYSNVYLTGSTGTTPSGSQYYLCGG